MKLFGDRKLFPSNTEKIFRSLLLHNILYLVCFSEIVLIPSSLPWKYLGFLYNLVKSSTYCSYISKWFVITLFWCVRFSYQVIWLQIFAVILCDTGIALLAYMDGINGSPTVTGVIFAVVAAAGSSIYKVSKAQHRTPFVVFLNNKYIKRPKGKLGEGSKSVHTS